MNIPIKETTSGNSTTLSSNPAKKILVGVAIIGVGSGIGIGISALIKKNKLTGGIIGAILATGIVAWGYTMGKAIE